MFRRQTDLLVLAVLCVLLALWANRWSDADLQVTGWFYDAASATFPLRRDAVMSDLLHEGVKWLSVLAWLGLLLIWGALRLRRRAPDLRARIAFVLWTSLLAAIAVNVARAGSAHSCPWSLTAFGGQASYFRLFDAAPAQSGSGHCLPSGHAATAFMWLAALPVLDGSHRRRGMLAVLCLGAVAGAVQVMRGAHFPSHVLLTASLCAAVALLCACVARR
ncbi:phosphatase PAP2 family protein [Methyloversatilis thermotolerans]|uniref:phosphatase PAP2 family protein n=1 Tax=Methyloversatilis thermotolerans TaxID=1346290 RepID=UPI0003A7B86D|nr:phosphatase PAP2 family protein [Methyloversatilis thermotolerans]